MIKNGKGAYTFLYRVSKSGSGVVVGRGMTVADQTFWGMLVGSPNPLGVGVQAREGGGPARRAAVRFTGAALYE